MVPGLEQERFYINTWVFMSLELTHTTLVGQAEHSLSATLSRPCVKIAFEADLSHFLRL